MSTPAEICMAQLREKLTWIEQQATEDAQKAEEERIAMEAKAAEEARLVEEARVAEEARIVEERKKKRGRGREAGGHLLWYRENIYLNYSS